MTRLMWRLMTTPSIHEQNKSDRHPALLLPLLESKVIAPIFYIKFMHYAHWLSMSVSQWHCLEATVIIVMDHNDSCAC
jgi:hypothetical protein